MSPGQTWEEKFVPANDADGQPWSVSVTRVTFCLLFFFFPFLDYMMMMTMLGFIIYNVSDFLLF